MSIIKQLNKPPVQADITEWTWKEWFQSVWRILKNFYSDGNTNYSGVGGDVPFIPESTFHVLASDTAEDGLIIEKDSATNWSLIKLHRPNLSSGAKFTNFPADNLGEIRWDAYRSSVPPAYTPAVSILGSVQGTPGTTGGYSPGQLELKISDGVTAPDTKVLINTDGNIGLLSGAQPGPANTSYDKVLFSGYHNILVGKTTKPIANAQLHIASNAEYAADAWSKIVAGPAVVSRQDAGSGQYDIWTFATADTVSLGGNPRFRINAAGDVSFNAIAGVANTGWQKVRYGSFGQYLYYNGAGVTNGSQWSHNAEYSSNGWVYTSTGAATLFTQGDVSFFWYTVASGTGGTAISSWTPLMSLGTGGLGVTTSGQTTSIVVTDTGANGANIKLIGNGATTPNKHIRAQGGNLGIVNSGYTGEVVTISDGGAITALGGITGTVLTTSGGSASFQLTRRDTGAVAWTQYSASGSYQVWNGSDRLTLDGSGNLNITGSYSVAGTQVVGTRKTGWGTPTGTLNRTTFDTGTLTLSVVSQRLGALITDLIAHGIIGA